MKKLFAVCAVSLLVAGQAVGMQVTMQGYTTGAGGYYSFNPDDTLEGMLGGYVEGKSTANGWYGSFCLEKDEYFKPGLTYDVRVPLDSSAREGGVNVTGPGADPISVGTAYLFEQFVKGTLSGFNYASTTSAAALQDMFWYLEGEVTSLTSGVAFQNALITGLGLNPDSWYSGATGDYAGQDVKVLNLSLVENGVVKVKQDQLAYVRTSVPDPASTLVLLGLGLAGVAAARRKLS